jgi:hypothetical protein
MKTQMPDLFFLFLLGLLLLSLATAQVVYVYAVFVRGGIHDVMLVKEVERRESDLGDRLAKIFIRSNTFQIG